MTTRFAGALALSLTAAGPGLAQDLAPAAEAAFREAIARHDIPGLVVGVTHHGRHSFYTTGLASRQDGREVTPDTLFELGSISKIFTVTLAALAEERGKLSLDAPLATHLPQLDKTPAGALTLMDLATHHSGGMPLQVPDAAGSTEDVIAWLAGWTPPQPGARSYSNVSIGLLGHVTAQAFEMPYADAAQQVLFPAMGLTDSWITVPAQRMPDYAWGYDRKTDAAIRVNPGVLDAEAYGVKSSARDLVKLLDLQLGHGGSSALRAAIQRTQQGQGRTEYFTQAMIWESYPWPAATQAMVAGNGTDFILSPQPMQMIAPRLPQGVILNKTGATNGFGGYVALIPSEDLGIVVLANRNYPNEARVRATHDLIQRLLAR
ncbi:class C beta-lactamase [Paracoccus shanxieyensis]|nr:class C beta-lactamase [Paracoccus shanxieyensis]